MKILKKVSVLEVKRTFVLGDHINHSKGRRVHLKKVSYEDFRKKFEEVRRKILKMKEKELDKLISYPKRLKSYNESEWHLCEFEISDLGVWPRAGGMPLSWTNKSLVETAKKVKYAIEKRPKLLNKRANYAITNMIKTNVKDFQKEKYLFPIVFKNGTGTDGRKRLKSKVKGDIDDGNMRAISLAIAGFKTIRGYFGVPNK